MGFWSATIKRRRGWGLSPRILQSWAFFCFGDGATKWRALRATAAIALLDQLSGVSGIQSWFRGEGRLAASSAVRAVLFLMGVDYSNNIPRGHPYANYFNALVWLCRRRLGELGMNKLEGVTRENLDVRCDWFVLDASMNVVCHTMPTTTLKLHGIDMTLHDDWCVVEGDNYAEAQLVSELTGVEIRLCRALEKQMDAPPVFATEFHFPEGEHPPGLPCPSTEPSSASSSGDPRAHQNALRADAALKALGQGAGQPLKAPA